VSATEKALTILAAFTPATPSLTLREIASRTGYSEPTVHRVTAELVAWGALERRPRGPFTIGVRLWSVAALATVPRDLREAAVGFLGDLHEATGENVLLSILEGDEALVIERLGNRRAVSLAAKEGEKLPLHASGVGQVLLAYGDDDLLERTAARAMTRYTEHTLHTAAGLRGAVDRVREAGYAVCVGAMRDDSMSIAAPVFGPAGDVVAALSIVVRADATLIPRYVPVVVAVANGVSRSIGSPRRITPR
jgi:DNA-binding IclR family transcriptional regulator